MIALDTNILLPAVNPDHPDHAKAFLFVMGLQDRDEVAISEFVLVELYGLLRNPVVLLKPLDAPEAVAVCEAFRCHPRWQILGFPPDSKVFHDLYWPHLRMKNFARRKAFDLRIALSLTLQGVTEFATVNLKDFEGMGFKRVWNPLEE
ncbi:PIN domain-containing protein [Prosthecobacter dejongeii]|uniref:Ribonuclease VapC n=1 Tax=Prosthecobacter dejongeii TaxID=48465 RepID=A0A7W7YIV1_9BACT|nr:VapC toxin family PIN domain ribonuclease [Prosthecobacter dejongeii]MBB5036705.1 putative nucleic acid-binding protein [Prosthecobacter dejongeii]